MAETNLHDFFVGLGFKLDTASQTKAEAAVKSTETKSTKIAEDASARRRKLEAKDDADRAKKRQEALKREEEIQTKSLKGMQVFALKAASFATKAFATIEASALGVVYAVDKAAKAFERLNYTSARSGASAGKVGAFGYAAGQLGSSKEEAEGQLQTFGQNLKLNSTGYGRALEKLGIKTRGANGQLRDSVDLATDLGDALRKIESRGPYGYANAMNQARVFGFEGDTARALMNPDFRKRSGQFGSDQSKIGADSDAAAKSGTAFEQSMRRLNEVLEQIGTRINGVLFVKLKPLLDQLAEWFLKNGDRIADIVSKIADGLVKLATAIGQQLADADWKTVLDNLSKMAGSFAAMMGHLGGDAGLIAKIGLLAIALRGLAGLAMPPWALAILGVGAAGAYGLSKLHDAAGDTGPDKSWDQQKRDDAEHGWFGTKYGAPGTNAQFRNRGRKAAIDRVEAGRNPTDYAGAGQGAGHLNKLIEDESKRAGIDPRILQGIRAGESGHGDHYDVGDINDGGAYGPFQFNMGKGRFGDQFKRETGYDPRDPKTIPQQTRYMAEFIARQQKADPNYANGGRSSRLHGVWHGYAGPRDPSPKWRDSGYVPPAPTVTKIPPMLKKPLAGAPDPLRIGPKPGDASYVPPMPEHVKLFPGEALGADGKTVVLAPQHTSMRGDTSITHSPTFHIAGGDVRQNMEAARLSASRGQQDLLRNVQGTLA